ncbi:MAG TPA: 50S ribosomal protein L16 [Candidatus Micrarchaeota archaeon]|nr:50S ribosomal protein L16 [Candidatus Micrarchaeota archaeon]
MGLRPGRTCKTLEKTAWARFSKRKPRKSFVKAMPHRNLNVYNMGDAKAKYEIQFDLTSSADQQRRDNAIESGRQAANKFLEKLIPNGYFFKVRAYPHNVIRENKMIAGAGADRLQKGMRKAFGRPTTRGARMRTGQILFSIKTTMANRANVLEAFLRAKKKLGSDFNIIETQIPN